MSFRALTATSLLIFLWLSPESATGQETERSETIRYTTVPGDTCMGIARRRWGDANRIDLIHIHNPWMGPPPHTLRPGTVLVLPVHAPSKNSLGPDAHVTAARREVRARPPAKNDWSRARPGMELYRNWRVHTQDQAAADLTFRDGSTMHMRENTLVIIYGGARSMLRRQTTKARLDSGTLRNRLGELSGGVRLSVETPTLEAQFRNGDSVVSVDEEGTTQVSNLSGSPATVISKVRRSRVHLEPGTGTTVDIYLPVIETGGRQEELPEINKLKGSLRG